MNKKKILVAIMVLIIIIVLGILIYNKNLKQEEENNPSEITPLEEMTEEQERQTMISLYFTDTGSKKLVPEARRIDAKELMENPYKMLVELLIEGPKNESLKTSIPEGTKVNKAVLKNETVEVDLSKEFIENQKGETEEASFSIYSIVNTLTELNEVSYVKILIDGEEGKTIKDISLKDAFTRKD